jgi:hypothetical protein
MLLKNWTPESAPSTKTWGASPDGCPTMELFTTVLFMIVALLTSEYTPPPTDAWLPAITLLLRTGLVLPVM